MGRKQILRRWQRVTRIEFTVEGDLPPKKDGANSMWNKPSEFRRLVRLRSVALQAMDGRTPLASDIVLELEIRCGGSDGDLDNFITGVCDGLQAASRGTPTGELWESESPTIRPDRTIAKIGRAHV